MKDPEIEKHPFTPFLPEGTKVVLCGTFPPKKEKWAMDFFYPNFYNDMWRIFGWLYFGKKDYFFDKKEKSINKMAIQEMLRVNKIGIGETVTEAIRTKDNASDKFLEIVTPVNLEALLVQIPECNDFVTTGEKAATVIASLTSTEVPKVGEKVKCEIRMKDGTSRIFNHWRMPSTSRAYPMKLEIKAEYYGKMLKEVGVLNNR